MPLLVPPQNRAAVRPTGPRPALRARSVICGRQRWDVAVLLRRPTLARRVESLLLADEGMVEVRANPVTGRVLVRHDPSIDPRLIGRRLRRAVSRALDSMLAPAAGTAAEPPGGRNRERSGSSRTGSPLRKGATGVLVGGAVALAVATCGRLLARPLVSLSLAAAATAAVVRRSWRRSERGEEREGEKEREPGSANDRLSLLHVVGPNKRRFAAATLLTALNQIAETAVLSMVSLSVMVIATGNLPFLAGLGVTGAAAQLGFLGMGGAVLCAAAAGLGHLAQVTWRSLGQAIEHDWRTRTYGHVQRLKTAEVEGQRTSQVTAALSEDITQMGSFFGTTMHDVVQLATSFVILVPAFLLLAPQISWIAFAPVPLVAWLSCRAHDRAAADHAASAQRRAQLTGRISDNLQSGVTVKASCTEDEEQQRITELSDRYRESNKHTDRSTVAQAQIIRACGFSALIGTLVFGGRAVLAGAVPAAAFGTLTEMPGMALQRLARISDITDQYRRTAAATGRVRRLNDLPVENTERGHRLPRERVRGRITLDEVTFAYTGRSPVLRGLSMDIPAGQFIGIVGPTGAGKTTVAKLLMRFREPLSGGVLLDGTDIRELALHDLRRAIGYVTQEPYLFDATIADNIRYGTQGATHEQLVAAARIAGADTFIEALPEGYDALVGERGAGLSGGQRQRVALARTILRDPPVVILDEATSAVDNETEASIQQALQAFGRDRTMIAIAHRLPTVRKADRIHVLAPGGTVAETGTHDELVNRGGLYASLWHLQSGKAGKAEKPEKGEKALVGAATA